RAAVADHFWQRRKHVSTLSHEISPTRQSIGVLPQLTRYSLAFEKCPLPIKPRGAESGEGCGLCSTRCRRLSIKAPFFCAYEPQRRKTIFSRFFSSAAIAASVKRSQPRP